MKPTQECITHRFACDCREAMFAEAMATQRKVVCWRSQSDQGLRLRLGELTAQEIRTIRAVLNAILPNEKVLAPMPARKSYENTLDSNAGSG